MKYFLVFLISMVPLLEQRAAIPYGVINGINPLTVFLISYLGSLVPVPFILLLFTTIFKWMKKYEVFSFINNIIEKKLQKNTPKIEKYKELGLIIFVAVPLPTTGLWTGSAVASFLGLDFKKSFLCTALGGLISAIIITLVSMLFPASWIIKSVHY